MLLLELICITGFGGFVAFLSVKSPLLLANIQFVSTNNHENAGKDPLGVCSSKHVQSMLHHVTPLFSCFNSHFFMLFSIIFGCNIKHFWCKITRVSPCPRFRPHGRHPGQHVGLPGVHLAECGVLMVQWESFQPKNKLSICLYMVSTYSQIYSFVIISCVHIVICIYSFVVTWFIPFRIVNHTHVSRNGFGEPWFNGYYTLRTGSKKGFTFNGISLLYG